MIMFDAYNTPALDPVTMDDVEAASIIDTMHDTNVPIYVRSFQGPMAGEQVTVFWSTTPTGAVGTVWEHTRENAFNVPMGVGDRVVEAMRYKITESLRDQSDTYDGYAVGE